MEIIGILGLSRTGSMSLRYALDDLGFKCYHMEVACQEFQPWRSGFMARFYGRTHRHGLGCCL